MHKCICYLHVARLHNIHVLAKKKKIGWGNTSKNNNNNKNKQETNVNVMITQNTYFMTL